MTPRKETNYSPGNNYQFVGGGQEVHLETGGYGPKRGPDSTSPPEHRGHGNGQQKTLGVKRNNKKTRNAESSVVFNGRQTERKKRR